MSFYLLMQTLLDKPVPGWASPLDEQDATGAVEWLLKFASRHKANDHAVVSEYLEAQ